MRYFLSFFFSFLLSSQSSAKAIESWQLFLRADKTLHLQYISLGNGGVELVSYQIKNTSGRETLTEEDKNYVTQILEDGQLSPEQEKLASFLIEMVPINESIGIFDSANGFHPYGLPDILKKVIPKAWQNICSSRGQNRKGFFHDGAQNRSVSALVGDPKTRCRGRCGVGCKGSARYTQECLNHDLCKETTGDNLGVCSGEFFAAAAGFLAAEVCP